MKIISIDYGERRTGIARADALLVAAFGVKTLFHKTVEEALSKVLEVIEEEKPDRIVLGLPKNMDATVGFRGKATLEFAEMLKQHFNGEIVMWDERLTTVSAIRTLNETNVRGAKRKNIIDTVAAEYILTSYLDSLKK